MKKGLMLLAVLALPVLPGPSQAQPPQETQRWIEQVDGGFVFPVSPTAARLYDRGVGGDILVGYRFTREFSLSADLGYYDCDQKALGAAAGEWVYTPILAVARYNFGPGWVRPYVLLGAGAAVNTRSLTAGAPAEQSNRETDFLLAPGLGVLFLATQDTALYVQARFDLDFSGPTGPWTASPVLFLPLKAGLSFFAF